MHYTTMLLERRGHLQVFAYEVLSQHAHYQKRSSTHLLWLPLLQAQ